MARLLNDKSSTYSALNKLGFFLSYWL
jgi:hypothetical protein